MILPCGESVRRTVATSRRGLSRPVTRPSHPRAFRFVCALQARRTIRRRRRPCGRSRNRPGNVPAVSIIPIVAADEQPAGLRPPRPNCRRQVRQMSARAALSKLNRRYDCPEPRHPNADVLAVGPREVFEGAGPFRSPCCGNRDAAAQGLTEPIDAARQSRQWRFDSRGRSVRTRPTRASSSKKLGRGFVQPLAERPGVRSRRKTR